MTLGILHRLSGGRHLFGFSECSIRETVGAVASCLNVVRLRQLRETRKTDDKTQTIDALGKLHSTFPTL